MKRIVTMQDISCVGKCSLTEALPVISAMGIECAVLPTAVLSTHTMFKGFTFHDLTHEIEPILAHWKKEDFNFDAIYTGYLGSSEQIAIAETLFSEFGSSALKVVDPCMADNGKLYAGFTEEFAMEMASLCKHADIICPNLTEACYLLNIPYKTEFTESEIHNILVQLTDLGADTSILTGVTFPNGQIGACAYTKSANTFTQYHNEEESEHFHGTGDLWASAFTAAMVKGFSLEKSLQIACDFVKQAIHCTLNEPHHNKYGVNFEEALPFLIRASYTNEKPA